MSRLSKAVPKEKREEIKQTFIKKLIEWALSKLGKK